MCAMHCKITSLFHTFQKTASRTQMFDFVQFAQTPVFNTAVSKNHYQTPIFDILYYAIYMFQCWD
jgi:hypothetical protein